MESRNRYYLEEVLHIFFFSFRSKWAVLLRANDNLLGCFIFLNKLMPDKVFENQIDVCIIYGHFVE